MSDIYEQIDELKERLESVEDQYSDAIDFASGTGLGTGYIGIQYETCIKAINNILDIIHTPIEPPTAPKPKVFSVGSEVEVINDPGVKRVVIRIVGHDYYLDKVGVYGADELNHYIPF